MERKPMTSKDRVHAALEGRSVDRFPVTALYAYLVYMDRFEELTGLPQWQYRQWMTGPVDDYMRHFRTMLAKIPFEILQPVTAPPRAERENMEIVLRDGTPYRHDRRADHWEPLPLKSRSGHAFDDVANQRQRVFDKDDVRRHVRVIPAEEVISAGVNDYIEATVAEFGKDEFILSGGVVGTVFRCQEFLGFTNLFAVMLENPTLFDYLSRHLLEQNVERIRCLAAAGGDAIYIDDAITTSDMISVAHYERFSLPGMKAMVNEIHRLGQKAILIYFGGVMDRLDQIASIGADGLLVETSMKNYVNEIEEILQRIGDLVTLFGNIDPVGLIQGGTDAELETEIRRQAAAGRPGRGFLISPASPLTPSTPLPRIRRFIELGKRIGAEVCGNR